MDLNKLEKYITDINPSDVVDKTLILVEKSKLQQIADEIEKNLKELEKKKAVSAKLIMDFQKMGDQLQKAIDKTNKTIEIHERVISIGRNAAAEVHGNTIVITKGGRDVEITKEELVQLVMKTGLSVFVSQRTGMGMGMGIRNSGTSRSGM